ncbi:uncharacterized protein MYCGRDRAFT_97730 [Zymoseptoria tritici IPO323]|uniref:Uncharacterized protein n=1 Tax=Zymoseptoria tritici (strain CBS 115943 / IPO323) TaxID=336722 RepID=F9XR70_ZYMTI|nr:uncharacterized protein MYCGRDRAFT_97730 [Zymoseptoria tritici IPO323]EGP82263.1 hypothetical protein MYCGRDRAFT_97730 [Zymoseptoria tritici IPO323]
MDSRRRMSWKAVLLEEPDRSDGDLEDYLRKSGSHRTDELKDVGLNIKRFGRRRRPLMRAVMSCYAVVACEPSFTTACVMDCPFSQTGLLEDIAIVLDDLDNHLRDRKENVDEPKDVGLNNREDGQKWRELPTKLLFYCLGLGLSQTGLLERRRYRSGGSWLSPLEERECHRGLNIKRIAKLVQAARLPPCARLGDVRYRSGQSRHHLWKSKMSSNDENVGLNIKRIAKLAPLARRVRFEKTDPLEHTTRKLKNVGLNFTFQERNVTELRDVGINIKWIAKMVQLRLCVQREKTGLLEDTAADLENHEITFGRQDGHRTQRSRSQRYLHLLNQNVNELKDFGLSIMLGKQNVIELKDIGLNITFVPSRGSALNGAERFKAKANDWPSKHVLGHEESVREKAKAKDYPTKPASFRMNNDSEVKASRRIRDVVEIANRQEQKEKPHQRRTRIFGAACQTTSPRKQARAGLGFSISAGGGAQDDRFVLKNGGVEAFRELEGSAVLAARCYKSR